MKFVWKYMPKAPPSVFFDGDPSGAVRRRLPGQCGCPSLRFDAHRRACRFSLGVSGADCCPFSFWLAAWLKGRACREKETSFARLEESSRKAYAR